MVGRRTVLGALGATAVWNAVTPAWAEDIVSLPLPGGPAARRMTTAFPQKGAMTLQRTWPALLETPFEVFDHSVFTPNDRFFVRWHWAVIPEENDAAKFRLTVRGQVDRTLSPSLDDLAAMPRTELAAVNQCSGNSRGLFVPRVAGGQWANGAIGNARWSGVRLKDVLDRAGIKASAVQVRFNGLDTPVADDAPDFLKSLDIDHARDGEVLDHADDQYWMKTAYRIPDTPNADVKPGSTGFKTVPINRMNPRSARAGVAEANSGVGAAAEEKSLLF